MLSSSGVRDSITMKECDDMELILSSHQMNDDICDGLVTLYKIRYFLLVKKYHIALWLVQDVEQILDKVLDKNYIETTNVTDRNLNVLFCRKFRLYCFINTGITCDLLNEKLNTTIDCENSVF